MWFVILVSTIILVWSYRFINKLATYWKDKNVAYIKQWPFSEKSISKAFQSQGVLDRIVTIYNTYPDKRYMGVYLFLQPILVIRDPDLIRNVMVKWFDVFPDHRAFTSNDSDHFWNKNLFAMKTEAGWHTIRSTLSPSFTSSKLKMMYELMQKCAENLSKYFEKQNGIIDVELKETFTKFTTDVIGTAAFGVTSNSLEEPDNEFFMMSKDAANFSGLRSLKFIGLAIFPSLMKLLGIGVFSKRLQNFFRTIIKETIKIREEKQIVRPDMVHLLMEARKGRLKYEDSMNKIDSGFAVVEESELGKTQKKQKTDITDEDIAALAAGFFFAGFDTVSNAMSFSAYELAINPDVQEKLFNEISEAPKDSNGKIKYETLLGMKYLDMVVSESLRKWPPAFVTDRVSVKSFTIEPENENEKPLHLEEGCQLWIPIVALHRDPKYYPNPDKFDPERFNDENKQNIKPFTYLPFGSGPRNCIGSRFALLEIKLLITEILRKFEIIPTAKTQIPLESSKKIFGVLPENGVWLGLKPRSNYC